MKSVLSLSARNRRCVEALLGGVILLSSLLLADREASAHARLVDPKPRNNSTQYKNETMACGGQPARSAAQPLTMLNGGAKFMVRFEETVDHPGCFLIDFSATGDTNWQELANVKHVGTAPDPSDQRPRAYMKEVTLPSAPCTACTIRVRQVMMESRGGEAAPCPPMPLGNTPTYFSCANVVINASGGSDAGVDGATGVDMGGAGGAGGSAGGSGGATGSGGSAGAGGAGGGGASGSGGSGGSSGSGGISGSGGSSGGSGGSSGTGGSSGATTGGSTGSGGSGTGGSGSGTGGSGSSGRGGSSGSGTAGSGTTKPAEAASPLGCSVGGGQPSFAALGFAAALLGRALRGRRRRR